MAPSLTKLYEKIIHQKLWKEIDEKGLIAENQSAYRKNRSTLNNLEATITQMKRIHQRMEERKNKLRKGRWQEPDYFKINIDAAKAFDSMRRDKIVELLLEKGMNKRLVDAIRLTLSNTRMRIDEEDVDTHIGVPQGSILSPTLFNLAINNILTDDNIKCQMLGYSDDLSAIVEGQLPMFLMLNKVRSRLAEVGIKMNLEKSVVMKIMPANSHRRQEAEEFYKVPGVGCYKYLGLEIDARLKFREEIEKRRLLKKELKKKEWIFRSSKLTQQCKYEVWQSLFKAKVSYAAEILCFECKEFTEWLKTFCYNAYKSLLGIRAKVNKEELLRIAVGHNWECWMTEKLNATRRKLGLKIKPKGICECEIQNQHSNIDITQHTPIKLAAKYEAFNLLKWKARIYLSGFKKIPGVQKVERLVKNLCKCDDTQLINTGHIEFCRQHIELRQEVLDELGLSYGQLKTQIMGHKIDRATRIFNIQVKKLEGIIKKHVFK